MNNRPLSAATAALAIVALGALFGAGVAAAEPAVETARFELPSDPGEVVISFTVEIGEIEGTDHAWLRIYADGRVVRHRPAYLKRSGDYVGEMSLDELSELVGSLAQKGIMEFDSKAVLQRKREVERKRSTLFEASDVSLITIGVRLESYQPAGSSTPQRDFQTTVSWSGLRHDAKRFPEIAEIQNLAAAHQQLNELARRFETRRRPAAR